MSYELQQSQNKLPTQYQYQALDMQPNVCFPPYTMSSTYEQMSYIPSIATTTITPQQIPQYNLPMMSCPLAEPLTTNTSTPVMFAPLYSQIPFMPNNHNTIDGMVLPNMSQTMLPSNVESTTLPFQDNAKHGIAHQVVQIHKPVMQTLNHVNNTLDEIPHPLHSKPEMISAYLEKVQQKILRYYAYEDQETQYAQQFYTNEALSRSSTNVVQFFSRVTALTLNRHPEMCMHPVRTFGSHLAKELHEIALNEMIRSSLQSVYIYHNEYMNRRSARNGIYDEADFTMQRMIQTLQCKTEDLLLEIYTLRPHDLLYTQHTLAATLKKLSEQKQLAETIVERIKHKYTEETTIEQ